MFYILQEKIWNEEFVGSGFIMYVRRYWDEEFVGPRLLMIYVPCDKMSML